MNGELLTAKQLAERAGIWHRSLNRIAQRLGFPRPAPGSPRLFTEDEARRVIADVATARGQFEPGNEKWKLHQPNLGRKNKPENSG